MKSQLTAERLREVLNYDPETGVFTWRMRRGSRGEVGRVAGSVGPTHGYWVINTMGQLHTAHRLAWLHVHGEWPKGQIDHINGERRDNRIANLRDVAPVVNMQNISKPKHNNRSGLLGAMRSGKRWMSRIRVDGEMVRLGVFDTPEEASSAYLVAKRRLHPGCTL